MAFFDMLSQRRMLSMKKRLFRTAILTLCLCLAGLWCLPALAEDSFTIDIDLLDMDRLNRDDYVARELSSPAQGVRVVKYISDSSELAAPVRLTIKQMDTGTLLFDKDYGFESHTFDSGVIYLPYTGERTTPYLVTLEVGSYIYAMPFMHQPRQREAAAENGSGGWADDSFWSDGWEDQAWNDGGWDDGWDSDAPGWE